MDREIYLLQIPAEFLLALSVQRKMIFTNPNPGVGKDSKKTKQKADPKTALIDTILAI